MAEPQSPSVRWDWDCECNWEQGWCKFAVRTGKNGLVELLGDLPARAERTGVIYLIQFENGKGYIGQTVQDLSQRINQHVKNVSGCKALSSALHKYGLEAVSIEVLAEAPQSELNALERQLIAEHKTMVPKGYNILPGGDQMNDPESQEMMRQARMASDAFQSARRDVQARPETTAKRRKTTECKREAAVQSMGYIEADRVRYDAWRHAVRHARLAAAKLPVGSSRDPMQEVIAMYGSATPTRDPRAVQALREMKHSNIATSCRADARAKRWQKVLAMAVPHARAHLKQARRCAIGVARRKHPERLKIVEAEWESEMCKFDEWARTQVPRASAQASSSTSAPGGYETNSEE